MGDLPPGVGKARRGLTGGACAVRRRENVLPLNNACTHRVGRHVTESLPATRSGGFPRSTSRARGRHQQRIDCLLFGALANRRTRRSPLLGVNVTLGRQDRQMTPAGGTAARVLAETKQALSCPELIATMAGWPKPGSPTGSCLRGWSSSPEIAVNTAVATCNHTSMSILPIESYGTHRQIHVLTFCFSLVTRRITRKRPLSRRAIARRGCTEKEAAQYRRRHTQ